MKNLLTLAALSGLLFCSLAGAQEAVSVKDSTAARLVDAGFAKVRSAQTDDYVIYTVENDAWKLQAEGFAEAASIVLDGIPEGKGVKIIATEYDVPRLTMTFEPSSRRWSTTTSLDDSWDLVRREKKLNDTFGKVNIVIYPQVAFMNLIINQVYQSLWQLSPALEVSLWPGMKFSYQMVFPIYNDGYAADSGRIHPGMVTLSQRFRDPWHLNVCGKLTVGAFSNSRYGAALEMAYVFPNERFSVDTQLGMVSYYNWSGFKFQYLKEFDFVWNVAANYWCQPLGTQFTLRAQKFLYGDIGLKYEMIRHFKRCSIGLYAEKAFDAQLNVGFRFQVALPPFRQKRRGYIPRVMTSSQMGMSYNANNELFFYKEFRAEASDNIMQKNAFNPLYVNAELNSK